MLDLNLIRENPDLVRTALKNRQMDSSPIDEILKLDEKRRALLTEVEQLKAERNAVSKEIGKTLAPGASAGVGVLGLNGT
jgi:seryl-tRNA synthetase